jgi:hypothetical protein
MHAINKRADPTSPNALLSAFGGGIIYITCCLLPSTSDEFVRVRIQPILHRIWIVPVVIKYVVCIKWAYDKRRQQLSYRNIKEYLTISFLYLNYPTLPKCLGTRFYRCDAFLIIINGRTQFPNLQLIQPIVHSMMLFTAMVFTAGG